MKTYVIHACSQCSTGGCCGGPIPKHSIAGVRAGSKEELIKSINHTVQYILKHDGQMLVSKEVIRGFSFDWKEKKWTLKADCNTEAYPHVLCDLLNRLMGPDDPIQWTDTPGVGLKDSIVIGGKALWVDFLEVSDIINDTIFFNDIEDVNAFC